MIVLRYLMLLGVSSLMFTCSKPTPEDSVNDTGIAIRVIDMTIDYAVISLSQRDSLASWDYSLERNDSVIVGGTVTSGDTVLVDQGLRLNNQYSYKAYFWEEGLKIDSTESLVINTPDSTTHEVTWSHHIIGGENAYVEDVWIVNDNEIIVAGQFPCPDPQYPDSISNLARFDGLKWEFEKVGLGGRVFGIHYYAPDDIWIAADIPFHWDGQAWTLFSLFETGFLGAEDGALRSVWGAESGRVTFVGESGTIVQWYEDSWQKIAAYTNLPLTDIWGINTNDLWIVGGCNSGCGNDYGAIVYRYNGDNLETIFENINSANPNSPAGAARSIWGKSEHNMWVTGYARQGKYDPDVESFIEVDWDAEWVHNEIRGNTIVDIYSVGQGSEVIHFNGSTSTTYSQIKVIGEGLANWKALDVSEGLVVVGGESYTGFRSEAHILFGQK